MADPVSLIITAVVNVWAWDRGKKRQRQVQEQLKRDSAPDVRISGSGQSPFICYGRTAVNPILVYNKEGSVMPSPPTTSTNIIGRIPAGQKNHNQLWAQQYILSEGECQGVIKVLDGERPFDTGEIAGSAIAHYIRSSASQLATDFSTANGNTERNANSLFTGRSYITTVLSRDRDDPKFNGPIFPHVVVDGVRVRALDTIGNVPAITTTRSGTRNAVAILLDYLLDTQYGFGLSPDNFELSSWLKAYNAAGLVVQGGGSVIYSTEVPQGIRDLNITDDETYDQWFTNSGFSGETDSGYVPSNIVVSGVTEFVRRYEFNGRIDTSTTHANNVDILLSSLPNTLLYLNGDGKWVIDVPDSRTPAYSQVVDIITPNDLLDPIIPTEPNLNTRLNSVSIVFANANKDLATDTITFPAPGSALETQWKAEDNGLTLHESYPMPGVINDQMATSIAASLALTSRNKSFSIRAKYKKLALNVGNVVQLVGHEELSGVRTYARIVGKQLLDDYSIRFVLTEFNEIDYAWYPTTKSLYNALNSVSTTLGDVQNIVVVAANGQANVTWAPNDEESSRVVGYELYRSTDPDSEDSWTYVASPTKGSTTFEEFVSASSVTGLRYRIRPKASNGQVGGYTTSSEVLFPGISISGAAEAIELAYYNSREPASVIPDIQLPNVQQNRPELPSGVTYEPQPTATFRPGPNDPRTGEGTFVVANEVRWGWLRYKVSGVWLMWSNPVIDGSSINTQPAGIPVYILWEDGAEINQFNIIKGSDEVFYICVRPHTASAANYPPNPAYWQIWYATIGPVDTDLYSLSIPATPDLPTLNTANNTHIIWDVEEVPGALQYPWKVSNNEETLNLQNELVTTDTTVTFSGAAFGPGRKYYFQLAARNDVGTSEFTNTFTATTTGSSTLTGVIPTLERVLPNGSGIISAMTTELAGATQYYWEISRNTSFTDGYDVLVPDPNYASEYDDTPWSVQFGGLNLAQRYYVRVTPASATGIGVTSPVASVYVVGPDGALTTPVATTQTYFVVADTNNSYQITQGFPTGGATYRPINNFIRDVYDTRQEAINAVKTSDSRKYIYEVSRTSSLGSQNPGNNWGRWQSDRIFDYIGPWAQSLGFRYNKGSTIDTPDAVSYNNAVYECITTHQPSTSLSPPNIDTTRWRKIST